MQCNLKADRRPQGISRFPASFEELEEFILAVEAASGVLRKSAGDRQQDRHQVNLAETDLRHSLNQKKEGKKRCDNCGKHMDHTTREHHFGPGPPLGNSSGQG